MTISTYRGKPKVDIREFYEKNGELLPGKKGISLTLEQWQILKEITPNVDACLEELAGGEK